MKKTPFLRFVATVFGLVPAFLVLLVMPGAAQQRQVSPLGTLLITRLPDSTTALLS
jgi:hypothetical protein